MDDKYKIPSYLPTLIVITKIIENYISANYSNSRVISNIILLNECFQKDIGKLFDIGLLKIKEDNDVEILPGESIYINNINKIDNSYIEKDIDNPEACSIKLHYYNLIKKLSYKSLNNSSIYHTINNLNSSLEPEKYNSIIISKDFIKNGNSIIFDSNKEDIINENCNCNLNNKTKNYNNSELYDSNNFKNLKYNINTKENYNNIYNSVSYNCNNLFNNSNANSKYDLPNNKLNSIKLNNCRLSDYKKFNYKLNNLSNKRLSFLSKTEDSIFYNKIKHKISMNSPNKYYN